MLHILLFFCTIRAQTQSFSFSEVRRDRKGYVEIEGPVLTPLKNIDLIVVGQDGVVDHIIPLSGTRTDKRGLLLLHNPSRPEFGDTFIEDHPCTFLLVQNVKLSKGQLLDPEQSGSLILDQDNILDSICIANEEEVGYECYSEEKIGTRKGLKKNRKEKTKGAGRYKSKGAGGYKRNELRRMLADDESEDTQDLGDFEGTWLLALVLSSGAIVIACLVVVAEKYFVGRRNAVIQARADRRKRAAQMKKEIRGPDRLGSVTQIIGPTS